MRILALSLIATISLAPAAAVADPAQAMAIFGQVLNAVNQQQSNNQGQSQQQPQQRSRQGSQNGSQFGGGNQGNGGDAAAASAMFGAILGIAGSQMGKSSGGQKQRRAPQPRR
ncbi:MULTISPECIES: hypothetical protein [Thiorhodovibrio]|uniref:hypothetical protein n=1 Tax=Thiorhodovibrio TaxID=61593 RepID=UPI001913D8B8|nr:MULTISPECIES: hypothetical protein [Thiorhodovibrio]WPL11629.1 hypothetical protein Thiosp_01379 [Thiorhodovibrio litoralis]